jgi:hypothetical protein
MKPSVPGKSAVGESRVIVASVVFVCGNRLRDPTRTAVFSAEQPCQRGDAVTQNTEPDQSDRQRFFGPRRTVRA